MFEVLAETAKSELPKENLKSKPLTDEIAKTPDTDFKPPWEGEPKPPVLREPGPDFKPPWENTETGELDTKPMKILNIHDAEKVAIPDDVKKTFQEIPGLYQPPQEWNLSEFDNTKGLLTRYGPNGEPVSYREYNSGNGEKVIVGSDDVRYYVKEGGIKPFEDVPEFKSDSGRNVINKGYVGNTYSDNVFYAEKIVYNGDGKLVRWEGPVFDNVSKFNAKLTPELLKSDDNAQFAEAELQLKDWIKNNPELAEQRFTKDEIDYFLNSGDRINVGNKYYTWHHTEEVGQLQMVDITIHTEQHGDIDGAHKHTGGMAIWGSGRNSS